MAARTLYGHANRMATVCRWDQHAALPHASQPGCGAMGRSRGATWGDEEIPSHISQRKCVVEPDRSAQVGNSVGRVPPILLLGVTKMSFSVPCALLGSPPRYNGPSRLILPALAMPPGSSVIPRSFGAIHSRSANVLGMGLAASLRSSPAGSHPGDSMPSACNVL